MKLFYKYISVLFLSLATMSNGAAQASGTSEGFLDGYLMEVTLGVALIVSLLVLLVLIVMLNVLKTFVNQQEQAKVEAAIAAGEKVEEKQEEGFLTSVYKKLTDAVPIEKEEKVLTSHEYDGIRELDNNLPPWWVYMFYITIVFAVVYLAYYHVFDGPSSEEEYRMEMAAADEQIADYKSSLALNIDESNVEVTEDPGLLAEGQQIFESKCAACHALDGGGGVGPNLTDNYWIHGGSIKDVFETIKVGVPQKGMISWESQMTPLQMQGVSSYILTLQGTTPQNPKDPEGELYTPKESEKEEKDADKSVDESSEAVTMNYL